MSFHLAKINPNSSPLQFPHFQPVLEEWTSAHTPVTQQLCCGAQGSWKLEAHWVPLLGVHSWSEHLAFSWQHNMPRPLPCPEQGPGSLARGLPRASLSPALSAWRSWSKGNLELREMVNQSWRFRLSCTAHPCLGCS